MIIILNDDAVYLSWVRRHRSGFVLETKRHPTFANTRLHRASCPEIRQAKSGRTRWTSGNRVKACALDRDELLTWAEEPLGKMPAACERCDPLADAPPAELAEREGHHHLTRLENELVSAVVESAVIHLDNQLEFRMTVGELAGDVGKTAGQISAALRRLADEGLLDLAGDAAPDSPLPAATRVFPSANSLRTVPAFAQLKEQQLERELAWLHGD